MSLILRASTIITQNAVLAKEGRLSNKSLRSTPGRKDGVSERRMMEVAGRCSSAHGFRHRARFSVRAAASNSNSSQLYKTIEKLQLADRLSALTREEVIERI
eukprot:1187700-Prorocentrum_minimum.AAC.6